MSNIEKYKEQSRITDKILVNINYAKGLTVTGVEDPRNDKHRICFGNRETWDSDIPVWLHASYGYYGNSDGYTACSPELQPYLIKALNHYKMDIMNYIVELAKQDKQNALIVCKEEAEKILQDINEQMIGEE